MILKCEFVLVVLLSLGTFDLESWLLLKELGKDFLTSSSRSLVAYEIGLPDVILTLRCSIAPDDYPT